MKIRNLFRLPALAIAIWLLSGGAADRLRALEPAAMQAMVIVAGDVGRGSAFVVKMDGRTYLVTNSHVVRGNRNVKFKDLHNAEITTGPLEIADQADIVRAEVTGIANFLELEPHIETTVKIGDEVIVAGNSEGEGVVREIPGKVVGIGPDRIEVDAGFVPGNSGSPILLKSTGKVIGVATYAKIPGGTTSVPKSPLSLNEVRRFGYRLDTVAKWVAQSAPDQLAKEGQILAEMDEFMTAITSVIEYNATIVAKMGASGFVRKEQAARNPAMAALAMAIDDFSAKHTAAATAEEKTKNVTAFFEKLKALVADEVRGLTGKQFSGFYAVQFQESLHRRKNFDEWMESTSLPAYREAWLLGNFSIASRRSSGPPIDPAKLKLVLSDALVASEPLDHRHHVSYPAGSQPTNLDNLFWIVESPGGERKSFVMHKTSLRVFTPGDGAYRVYVEYRGADKPWVVSNVVELKITGTAEAAAAPVPAAAPPPVAPLDKSKPLADVVPGTKWLWHGREKLIMEFRKDGKIDLDDWTQKGVVTAWAVTGPNEVKLTVLEGKSKHLEATLVFDEDRTSFQGTDFDPKRLIPRSPRVAVAPHQDAVALGAGRTMLLAKELEPQWQHLKGDWKIDDGALTGRGNSITDCYVTIAPPFTLEYKIKVMDGIRPRVRLGPIECGNEGYEPTLALYPPGREAGAFPYDHDHSYDVSLIVTAKSVELYVDGQLISTGPGLDKELNKLEFCGGDSWSKGVTEYRDIVVIK